LEAHPHVTAAVATFGPPRVVFGMPAYNRPDMLAQTLESLLLQTRRDFRIVITDDRPTPEVAAIVESYVALGAPITYEPNPERLGMIGNWRKAFFRSRELHPDSEYFAWVSDHDSWHPRWLEALVGVLDGDPDVVMAYPQSVRVFPYYRRRVTYLVGTVSDDSREQRLLTALGTMTAGNGIYGLFRARALERAGVFRPVLLPDRQLLEALALLGTFRHVPEILWYREVAGFFSYRRQRQMFFPHRAPLHTYLPAAMQHCGVLLWDFAIKGRGRPDFGRLAGARYALLQLWFASRRSLLRKDARWRSWLPKKSPAVLPQRSADGAPDE
jgi:glycosyltransferase involved in cell wall biosynthesis